MTVSNSRSFTTKFNLNIKQMEAGLKARGITKPRRKRYIDIAASGRASDLAEQARTSIAERRIAGVGRS